VEAVGQIVQADMLGIMLLYKDDHVIHPLVKSVLLLLEPLVPAVHQKVLAEAVKQLIEIAGSHGIGCVGLFYHAVQHLAKADTKGMVILVAVLRGIAPEHDIVLPDIVREQSIGNHEAAGKRISLQSQGMTLIQVDDKDILLPELKTLRLKAHIRCSMQNIKQLGFLLEMLRFIMGGEEFKAVICFVPAALHSDLHQRKYRDIISYSARSSRQKNRVCFVQYAQLPVLPFPRI
jgi:hypothetical protein